MRARPVDALDTRLSRASELATKPRTCLDLALALTEEIKSKIRIKSKIGRAFFPRIGSSQFHTGQFSPLVHGSRYWARFRKLVSPPRAANAGILANLFETKLTPVTPWTRTRIARKDSPSSR
jgi:hypothetical protein